MITIKALLTVTGRSNVIRLLVFLGLTTLFLSLALLVYAQEPSSFTTTPHLSTIVGGQPADIGEWPWQARVVAGSANCGGVLVAAEWVLTAAHCVYGADRQLLAATSIHVTLGDHDRLIREETEQSYPVRQVIPHPNYHIRTHTDDITLLQLAQPARLNHAVRVIAPIIAPDDDWLVAPDTVATVTGWGITSENGPLATLLMEVTVPLVANQVCGQVYAIITDKLLCAGYAQGGKDSCQGDSGGPLVVADGNDGWKLAGLVFSGHGCARPGFYGIYIRISAYVAWLAHYIPSLTTVATPTPTLIPTSPAPEFTPPPVTTLFPSPFPTAASEPTNQPTIPLLPTTTMLYLPIVATDGRSRITDPVCALNEQETHLAELVRHHARQQRLSFHCNAKLAGVARARALDMGQRRYFGHVNPDGFGPNYLVRAAGYGLPATYDTRPDSNNIESIGAGAGTADSMWNAWLQSTKHSTHLLGLEHFYAEQIDYGIGFAQVPDSPYQFYWVFISAKPASSSD